MSSFFSTVQNPQCLTYEIGEAENLHHLIRSINIKHLPKFIMPELTLIVI